MLKCFSIITVCCWIGSDFPVFFSYYGLPRVPAEGAKVSSSASTDLGKVNQHGEVIQSTKASQHL